MNSVKAKYNALSTNEKVVALSIIAVLVVIVIAIVYNAGEVTGSALYNWTR